MALMTADQDPEHDAERDRAVAVRDRVLEPPRDTEGAPSVQAQARGELLALKSAAQFCCTRPDGSIRPALASGEGFYAADTRHLSELRLTIAGRQPVLLSSAMESGHHAVINATNPVLSDGSSRVPQDTLNLRQTVLVSDSLYYDVAVRNFHRGLVATEVAVSLAADFADVFEVRGVDRRTGGSLATPTVDGDLLRFGYVALDGQRRETLVRLHPTPRRVLIEGDQVQVVWAVELEPGAELELGLTVTPVIGGRASAEPGAGTSAELLAADDEEWADACARISSDNELFDALIDASVRDLHALMMPVGDSELPAAGIPWYVAPFGRDSLLSACEVMMINPAVARGTLLVLAGLQADADEEWRDAEPGKILHELRVGELARTGQIPHTPYYGTVDATPLFLMVAGGYYRWTLDLDTMRRLRPALDAALVWIDDWGDRDGDGFVEYERRSPAGLRNHGWKDSDDSIMHADGSLAQGPIALVEVQGYVYEAKLAIADVYDALGEDAVAGRLRREAAALAVRVQRGLLDGG